MGASGYAPAGQWCRSWSGLARWLIVTTDPSSLRGATVSSLLPSLQSWPCRNMFNLLRCSFRHFVVVAIHASSATPQLITLRVTTDLNIPVPSLCSHTYHSLFSRLQNVWSSKMRNMFPKMTDSVFISWFLCPLEEALHQLKLVRESQQFYTYRIILWTLAYTKFIIVILKI